MYFSSCSSQYARQKTQICSFGQKKAAVTGTVKRLQSRNKIQKKRQKHPRSAAKPEESYLPCRFHPFLSNGIDTKRALRGPQDYSNTEIVRAIPAICGFSCRSLCTVLKDRLSLYNPRIPLSSILPKSRGCGADEMRRKESAALLKNCAEPI